MTKDEEILYTAMELGSEAFRWGRMEALAEVAGAADKPDAEECRKEYLKELAHLKALLGPHHEED